MELKTLSLFAYLSFSLQTVAADNPWERIKVPASGPSKIFGGYSAGCLQGAVSLAPTGAGYQFIRTSRNRFYGHRDAMQFIRNLGEAVAPEDISLLIADIAMPRGGPFSTEHASHQIGLDVDIFFRLDERAQQRPLTLAERELIEPIALADLDRNELNEEVWDERHRIMLRTAAQNPRTLRIFVHPTIKRKLCQDPENHQDWLRKIRPWWGHNYHFHVRLDCPESSPACHPQSPPTGIGCDESLDWWFSEEWRREYEERKRRQQEEIPEDTALPQLPAQCQDVLAQ